TLEGMPPSNAAPAAFAVASAFARSGQWALAREAFLLVTERYPTHPLALESYRWLIAHNASSEARRRHEMGQFIVATGIHHGVVKEAPGKPKVSLPDPHLLGHEARPPQKGEKGRPTKVALPPPELPKMEAEVRQGKVLFSTPGEARRWYQGALAF